MAVKYKEAMKLMVDQNKELFDQFLAVHQAYQMNKESNKERFDMVGKEVLRVITATESRLCSQMEKGNKGVFSSNLSEKFWAEVRKLFPLIDEVGVKKTFVK
jgi:hypothetical protein